MEQVIRHIYSFYFLQRRKNEVLSINIYSVKLHSIPCNILTHYNNMSLGRNPYNSRHQKQNPTVVSNSIALTTNARKSFASLSTSSLSHLFVIRSIISTLSLWINFLMTESVNCCSCHGTMLKSRMSYRNLIIKMQFGMDTRWNTGVHI